tara:strand:+ start:1493 stop:1777 length:285 start_codon:yes stop_codon:yes gene_type:complete
MSHESYFPEYPELIIEPEWPQSITITSDLNYFYVPSLPEWTRYEYDGLLYEGTQYNWNEVDYRLSADLTIPEPSTYALILGFAILAITLIKRRK